MNTSPFGRFASILTFYVIIISFSTRAQQCEWAKRTIGNGGGGYLLNGVSASDNVGNVYILSTSSNDSVIFDNDTLINGYPSSSHMYVAKYDSTGNIIWAKGFGGSSADVAYSIATDASGNVYISGLLGSDSVYFDTILVANTFHDEIFVAKIGSDGNAIWVRTATTNTAPPGNTDVGTGVAADPFGNVYITGYYTDSIFFGSTALSGTMPLNTSFFITKYDGAGNVLWARSATTGICNAQAITTDAAGNAIITGNYFNGNITAGAVTLPASGPFGDIFIFKYDSLGNVVWGSTCTNNDETVFPFAIATDAVGNVYLDGYFYGDSVTFGSDNLVNAGPDSTSDIFLVKFSNVGSVVWAKRAGGADDDIAPGMAVSAGGQVIISGTYGSPSISFDSIMLTIPDFFLAAYNTSGGVLWAKSADSSCYIYPQSISLNTLGNLYLSGQFYDTIHLGEVTLAGPISPNTAVFVARYIYATTGITAVTQPGTTYNIYPNPAGNEINIAGTEKIARLTISNILGQTVYSPQCNDNSIIVNISTLPPGMYFVDINGTVVRKIIKQ